MAEFLDTGHFAGAPVDLADGYIHLSAAEQLAGTLDRHFAGQEALHLVAVDLAALGDAVRWEVSRGSDMFPHLYAALPRHAVRGHGPVSREADGALVLPAIAALA